VLIDICLFLGILWLFAFATQAEEDGQPSSGAKLKPEFREEKFDNCIKL